MFLFSNQNMHCKRLNGECWDWEFQEHDRFKTRESPEEHVFAADVLPMNKVIDMDRQHSHLVLLVPALNKH